MLLSTYLFNLRKPILKNISEENTCAGVSTYLFNSQSMSRPDKCRSSHWRCSVKKGLLKNLANFTGKHLFGVSFNKVPANQAYNFTKIRLQHRCFPVKFSKFLRKPILKNIC